MIPSSSAIFSQNISNNTMPSKNYKMNLDKEIVRGYSDNIKAMEQVVFKILNTNRYNYVIYSWNYGVELEDLFGKSVEYVCIEVKRRIKEALLQDDRIDDVADFEFDISKRSVVGTKFSVVTVFGRIISEMEVSY